MFGLMGTATVIALLGWGLAHYFYSGPSAAASALADRMPGVYTTLLNKYYVDELYDRLFVEPTKQLGRLCDWFDRTIIDGIVRSIDRGTDASSAAITWTEKHVIYAGLNIIGYANHLLARSWRRLQTGMVHQYAAIIVAGLFILVHLILLIWTGAGSTGYSSR